MKELKINLINSEKSFLATLTRRQPIEPIIKLCYQQFKITVPDDMTKAKLSFLLDGETIVLDQTDFNKRFGAYKIPKDVELVFEP